MKKVLLSVVALGLVAIALVAQNPVYRLTRNVWVGQGTSAEPVACGPGDEFVDSATYYLYSCTTGNSWTIGSNQPSTGTGSVVRAVSPTITTPTLVNQVIIGPAAVNCGTACTATSGQLILSNLAAGTTVTIPTSSGSGNVIRVKVLTTTTSAAIKVLLATTTDAIIGTGSGFTGSTAKIFVGNASTYHSIQMPFTGSQPSGGFAGDSIVCTDLAAGTWACGVQYQAGTTPTTPYSTATT